MEKVIAEKCSAFNRKQRSEDDGIEKQPSIRYARV
jgi:hypothetical protein